jgi:nucleoside 2-deoxyribosyltransferase
MSSSTFPKLVYLAGGFHSGWQREVIKTLPSYRFLDPSQHDLADPRAYVEWDLDAIARCDLVLANMEASNPGGYALALELGYAKALHKAIVLVDQLVNEPQRRYFEMVRHCADHVFDDLGQAIRHLQTASP